MFLVDKDSAAELPVILRDDDIYSSAKAGIAHGSITLKFMKWGATSWTTDVIDATNWTESGHGHYKWNATASDLDTKGLFLYIVQANDCVQYEGAVYVSGNDLDDIVAAINALNDLDAAAVLAALTTDSTKWAGANIANLNQSLSATESNIRGADSDTLKTISDEISDLNDLAVTDILSDSVAFDGANINATISSRSTLAQSDILSDVTPFDGANISNLDRANSVVESNIRGADSDTLKTLSEQIDGLPAAGDMWDALAASHVAVDSFGELVNDYLDAAVSSRSTLVQADILSDGIPFAGANISNLDQASSVTESNIRGADSDTLETLSDQIDGIGGGGGATAEEIADAVLDELLSEHVISGSLSAILQAIYDEITEGAGDCKFE